MTEGIEVAREGAVVAVFFARPDKKNAITGAMYEALTDALEKAERDAGVGAVVIGGRGGVFTAGNDIADFLAIGARTDGGIGDSPGSRFIRKLADFTKPLVAAVNGLAVGVGTTLCFHCDLVYASEDARFQAPFVDLGLVPEAGASLLAPERLGWARAAELLLLAEPFDAEKAHALGFVNAVLPQDKLLVHAMSQAKALAAKPRAALLETRRLMRGDLAALRARMTEELEAFGAALASDEARAAFAAFLRRGKP